MRDIEGNTITGGHTLIQVVKFASASDHIEVSVHQDVVCNGEKREVSWHYGGLLTEYRLEYREGVD